MAYTFDITRTLEAPAMDGLYENVKRQFKDRAVSQKVIYNTPRGSFTVSMEVRDKTQFDSILGIAAKSFCQLHQQEEAAHFEHSIKVTECRTTMKVTYESDFNDEAMKKILSQYVDHINLSFYHGIRSISCIDCNKFIATLVKVPVFAANN